MEEPNKDIAQEVTRHSSEISFIKDEIVSIKETIERGFSELRDKATTDWRTWVTAIGIALVTVFSFYSLSQQRFEHQKEISDLKDKHVVEVTQLKYENLQVQIAYNNSGDDDQEAFNRDIMKRVETNTITVNSTNVTK